MNTQKCFGGTTNDIPFQNNWLCLICRKLTQTGPGMLRHLRHFHRPYPERIRGDLWFGWIHARGGKKLAVYIGAETRKERRENIQQHWSEAHKGAARAATRAKELNNEARGSVT